VGSSSPHNRGKETTVYDTAYTPPPQKLAHRRGDGLDVTLFWSAADDALTVQVIDHFADECFEIAVSHDRVAYAFNHPYAYAAAQGLDYDEAVLNAA
jgi:hypothetical protein